MHAMRLVVTFKYCRFLFELKCSLLSLSLQQNSWDLVDGKYPLSNACGQLGQKYEEYHCPEHEKHMECPVDPNMSIKGVTHAKWYGAPGPLFCGPKSEYE